MMKFSYVLEILPAINVIIVFRSLCPLSTDCYQDSASSTIQKRCLQRHDRLRLQNLQSRRRSRPVPRILDLFIPDHLRSLLHQYVRGRAASSYATRLRWQGEGHSGRRCRQFSRSNNHRAIRCNITAHDGAWHERTWTTHKSARDQTYCQKVRAGSKNRSWDFRTRRTSRLLQGLHCESPRLRTKFRTVVGFLPRLSR